MVVLAWLSLAVGVVGVVLAVVFYLRGRKQVRPVFRVRDLEIVSDDTTRWPGLGVTYRKTPVKRLTLSEITFWNAGTDTLDGDALVVQDLLRVEVPEDVEILDARVAVKTRDVTDFTVEPVAGTTRSAALRFDFLDPGDGATVLVMHTGGPGGARVRGTIKGVPDGPANVVRGAEPRGWWWGVLPPVLAILTVMMVAVVAYALTGETERMHVATLIAAVASGLAAGFFGAPRLSERRRPPRELLSPGAADRD